VVQAPVAPVPQGAGRLSRRQRDEETGEEETRTDRAWGHYRYFFSTVMLFKRTGSVP
jgi:hypothetical protein